MIHIRVHPEEIPQEWLKKAAELTEELNACKDDDEDVLPGDRRTAMQKRKDILERNQPIWKDLKEILMRWSYNKCWYSEVRDVGSDYHVDHFRPKGLVKNPGEEEREGYWWLAFDWRNFRIAAAWCNSPHKAEEGPAKGKQNQFPLSDKCVPASCPEGIALEEPALLDPTSEFDVLLIDFDETGLPQPVMDGWNQQRVLITRRVLHLDAPRMVEARQDVWRKCHHALLQAHSALNLPMDEHRNRDDRNAVEWIRKICEMLRPDAPLSAVARACVLKSEFRWTRSLLNHPFLEMVG